MPIKLANNASAHLAAPLDSASTTIVLVAGEVGNFPSLGAGEWHPMTLVNAGGQLEVVKVTARSANILTVVRAQEGTTGLAFIAGDRAELRATAAVFSDLQATIAAGDAGLSAGLGALQGEVTALETEVDTKASQAAVDALGAEVDTKLDAGSNNYVHATGGNILLNFTGAKPNLAKGGTPYGDLATEAFVTAAIAAAIAGVPTIPAGSILPYAGGSVPTGFLLPYGQAVSRSTYAALFSAIGTTHGAGDGSTTFNLPDLRGRVPAGVDNMGGTAANRITSGGSGITGTTLGAAGGAQSHTLTVAQLPSHDHGGDTAFDGSHAHSINGGSNISGNAFPSVLATASGNGFGTIAGGGAHSHSISAQGGGGAHNNVQPTIVVNWMIKT